MTRRAAIGVLATMFVLAATAGAAEPRPGDIATGPAPHAPSAAAAPDERELRLGRAVLLSWQHDLRGVVEQLEPVDFAAEPAFAGRDRAAFLLGQAYLELGESARFEALARSAARWPHASAATRWLAREAQLSSAESGAPADASSADSLASSGARAIHAEAAPGAHGAARLAAVDAHDPWAARALHVRGLEALEHGESARGEALLDSALAVDPAYDARREALLALAADAMDHERWAGALERYDASDRDWAAQHDGLERLAAGGAFADVWAAWATAPDSSGALVLDAGPVRRRAFQLASMGAAELPEPPAAAPVTGPAIAPVRVLRPDPERWSEVAASARAAESARAAAERARWDVAREETSLADQRRYLQLGLDSLRRADARMAPHAELLDSLRARLDATDRSLRAVRDGEAARVARRTAALLAACDRQAEWADGLHQLYVAGPDSARYVRAPQGMPSGAATLAAERALTRSVRALAEQVSQAAPGWLARSYDRAWSPRLLDRVDAQAREIAREHEQAVGFGGALDSTRLAALTSPALAEARARLAFAGRAADSASAADAALRIAVAREAVNRTLAAIEREREGIDYGRAAALYALAVRLGAPDSARAPVALGAPAPDTSDAREDSTTARARGAAMPALEAFLRAHGTSAARGEMRFRLADLELADARQKFRERMAEFVRRQSEGRSAGLAVPTLDPTRALALYRTILAEDRDFPHLDAVRFNAGMILADAGEPEAERFFADLVATAPNSPYAQEAWLRMGDMAFDAKDFPTSVGRYEHAAGGADATLAAIASYKLGWAHFNRDEFEPAADAFRSVLDLYGARRADVHVDIESEAREYLVHALAGAGGAPAFARAFDAIGPRPYAEGVLMALGQQYRRYGEFADATAADQMVLDRYPSGPDALVAAERMVDTWRRAGHPERETEAEAALAPRFAPGGAWHDAQASDSLRDAGEAFAHASWMAVARAHHERARAGGAPGEWRAAVATYETVLAHWPEDTGASAIRMAAGEASERLGDHAGAARWYAEAARDGRDSVAGAALVQRVASLDAWYEATRAGRPAGDDSLAHAVLDAGDDLLRRVPAHPRAADVTWRQSQLALAHGWNDRADTELARMTTAHPADPRAALAGTQRAELAFRLGRFDDAGHAFDEALALARTLGRDSLARVAESALPVCAYRGAEAAVAADSSAWAGHAARFEQVAARWPAYELAPLARYRAGVAYARAGEPREAVRDLRGLLQAYPNCTYAGDARLRIAQAWETTGERDSAALAYLDFSRGETNRDDAAAAWLKAADLFAVAGREPRADSLRLDYIRRFPADVEGAMTILEAMSRRELALVGPAHPVSALLGTPSRSRRAVVPPASHLADYLRRAAVHPALASRDLVAQVRFLQGEESADAFTAVRLTQPLAKSVPVKKALLDTVLVRYRRAADLGVARWAHAAAFRMGEALHGFADALEHSDAPADLSGDDLRAYRNVLAEKAAVFGSRGDDVWSALLRQQGPDSTGDAWVERARGALVQRLAKRFLFRPEVAFPLVEGDGPSRAPAAADAASPAETAAPAARTSRALARREGTPR